MSSPFVAIKPLLLSWQNGQPWRDNHLPYCLKQDNEFIDNHDFAQRWQTLTCQEPAYFTIASLSFGSGFDFLTTWNYWLQYAPASASLYYFSSESTPLCREDFAKLLLHWPQLANQANALLAAYPILTPGFHQLSFDNGRIHLILMLGQSLDCFQQLLCCGDAKIEKKLRYYHVNAWYCHDNAPIDNELGAIMAMLSKRGTTLTAKWQNRADELTQAGFQMQAKRAVFHQTNQSSKQKQTPWHSCVTPLPSRKKAIILGAGLAGCFTAWSLARRGWDICLVDASSQLAAGASGNPQAILYPALSAFSSPFTDFMLSAYLYAHQYYSGLLTTQSIGELSGILQLATHPKDLRTQNAMQNWLANYPELGRLVNKDDASLLAGIAIENSGMYLPLSGWLDCKALCSSLVNHPSIEIITNYHVDELIYDSGQWILDHNLKAETCILANSIYASQFQQTAYLPLKPAAGQLTMIASNDTSERLKLPICGTGHMLPARQKQHVLGATYHPKLTTVPDYANDNHYNLTQVTGLSSELIDCSQIVNHWQGFRATTPDYLPLVGLIPEQEAFLKTYASLATDSKRWLPYTTNYYPGLYVCAGFGSRGLTTIPLCSEWLASVINQEPSCLPLKQIKSLSPARFLVKDLCKK